MTYAYGRSSASAMISAALSMRLFIGMAVDDPAALNATWVCPLVGAVICLPLLFAIRQAQGLGSGSAWENLCSALPCPVSRVLECFFALALAYDAASVLRLTASSSNIIALGDATVHLLIVPLVIVCAAAIFTGGDALGDSVRIALCILPLFLLIVLLVQLSRYRIGWLTPILGSGGADILRGGVYCAGCMALLSLPWLIAVPDRGRSSLLKCTLLPAAGISALLVTQQMCAPAMPDTEFTRAARIELVLSNGRISLYPQFVLNLLWYGALLCLLAAEAASAAAFVKRAFPILKRWMLSLSVAAPIGLCAVFNPGWLKASAAVTGALYMVLGALLALPMLLRLPALRREKT